MRINHHHYIHFVADDVWTPSLRRIEAQGDQLMATVDQMKAVLARIAASAASIADTQTELADGQAELAKDVRELVAKIGTGEPFTPEEVADAESTATKLEASAAAVKSSADALRDLGVATDASTVGAPSQPVVVTPPADSGL